MGIAKRGNSALFERSYDDPLVVRGDRAPTRKKKKGKKAELAWKKAMRAYDLAHPRGREV